MPPSIEDRLKDILEAIVQIEAMLADTSFDQFSTDMMRRMATERCLEIACEAARKLPDELKRAAPEIDWRNMNGFANLLRHAYHQTRADIVWNIARHHLPQLKAFVEAQIQAQRK
ncbi:DUF86 domain-containing protein [Bradyrhizobium diazoefficiens]|nr:HepT-like ribonuclease domain-containing protein [Bradyrhizobium diazoefficiens]QQO21063.1 DUF86 domain-containing protein [Bradyrhizobium diazoefficiens]